MSRSILSIALVLTASGFMATAAQNATDKTSKGEGEGQLSKADRNFVDTAAEINLTEIRLGKLAQDNAASMTIKKFGERSSMDHSKMNKELRELAKSQGIKLADKLDKKHQDLVEKLTGMKGADFDRTYTKDMVKGHEEAVLRFEAEAKSGKDQNVRAWAEKWLPTLREHLRLARAAEKDVNSGR